MSQVLFKNVYIKLIVQATVFERKTLCETDILWMNET